jgi:hypothetical protein
MRIGGRVSTFGSSSPGGRNVTTRRLSVWDVVSVDEPRVDLTESEANDVRREALLTLHELSESWWSGERRRLD